MSGSAGILGRYLAVLADDGWPVAGGRAELRSGQFHDVVLAADLAYRFPKDEQTRRALPGRVALLTALGRGELPVLIPQPAGTDALERPLGTCYVALQRLAGEPADAAMVSGPVAAALAGQLADLLDRLAVLGIDRAIRRAVRAEPADAWTSWADQVRQVLYPLMSPAGRRRAEAELTAVTTVRAGGDALVHGDLGGGNLLMQVTAGVPRLTGILDWDEASIGDQASDLGSLAATFGWPLADRIDRARGGPGGLLAPAARLIAATFALQQALPAALSGDTASLDDGLLQYR